MRQGSFMGQSVYRTCPLDVPTTPNYISNANCHIQTVQKNQMWKTFQEKLKIGFGTGEFNYEKQMLSCPLSSQ